MRTIRAVDLFCGAGGTSSGLLAACEQLGAKLDLLAINHWAVAIATHQANLPSVRHLCADVASVDPRGAVPSGRLDFLWASPECKFFSTARGGRPINDQKRADPWQVIRWASELYVRALAIENVPEFRAWGPLNAHGRPIKSRRGETYQAFLETLRRLGYAVEDRVLNAADYGDPTTRRRLFILARRDGRPIRWPGPTHAAAGSLVPGLKPWRAAREIIDWSLEGESIFGRRRPLSPNTIERIIAGLQRFGGPELGPFLVVLRGTDPYHLQQSARPIELPLPSVCASTSHFGLAEPVAGAFLLGQQSGGAPRDVADPVPTVATDGAISLVEFLVPHYSEREGQKPRTHSLDQPMPTVPASKQHGLVQAFLIHVNHGNNPRGSGRGNGGRVRSTTEPMPTVTSTSRGLKPVSEPLDTVTTKDRFGLVTFEKEAGGLALDIRFRLLKSHELARAQSLGHFRFAGNVGEQVRQIGNAVPRELATALCLVQLA